MRDDHGGAGGPAPEGAASGAGKTASLGAALAKERQRDTRLDFFRGLGMFIILIAHIPWNSWTLWIPARFGWSDATEIFVFCSGAASAIAFLKVFQTKGWWIGTTRVSYRIWQIYWCHVGVFAVIAASMVMIDQWLDNDRYYETVLNLRPFFDNPGPQLVGLLTLTYVPNYFDILVMYIVILALMPVVVALARIRRWLALGFSVALWAAVSQPWIAFLDVPIFTGLNLPAEPWSDRTWFFNPFAWQLVFFTGFAFSVGWLPRPPVTPWLIGAAAAVVLLSVPFAWHKVFPYWETTNAVRDATVALWNKTFFGLFRYLHFLALAYLAWVAAGENGHRLPMRGFGGRVVTVVRRVGQQSLAVFVASLLLARLLGVWINETGRGDALVIAGANLLGFVLIVGVAYAARFYRRQPWKAG